jgi:hypothetical protein
MRPSGASLAWMAMRSWPPPPDRGDGQGDRCAGVRAVRADGGGDPGGGGGRGISL